MAAWEELTVFQFHFIITGMAAFQMTTMGNCSSVTYPFSNLVMKLIKEGGPSSLQFED